METETKVISFSPPKDEFRTFNSWEVREIVPIEPIDKSASVQPTVSNKSCYAEAPGPARYLVEEMPTIGEGGVSGVYKGWDRRLGRFVAVKRLDALWASKNEYSDIIELEAKTMARLKHPGIPEVYDFASAEDPHQNEVGIMIMQFITEPDLYRWLEDNKPLNLCDIVRIISQTASTIDFMNTNGLFHGDIKPKNIMLTKPHIKIIDQGSSNWVTEELIGTPGYAAPEMYINCKRDARTDVYSLTVTAFYTLCSEGLPEMTENSDYCYMNSKIRQGIFDHRKRWQFTDKQIDDLTEIIAKGVSFDPDKRFQMSGEFAEEFCRVLNTHS